MTGHQRDGAVVACDRIVKTPKLVLRIAPVVQRVGMLRIERHRPVEAGNRLLETPQPHQHVAAVKMRAGEIRLQGDGVVAVRQGLIQPLQHHENDGQIAMRRNRLRVEQQRPPEQPRRGLGIAAQLFGHAEHVQGVEVVRPSFQHPPIGGLGVVKLAEPLVGLAPGEFARSIKPLP